MKVCISCANMKYSVVYGRYSGVASEHFKTIDAALRNIEKLKSRGFKCELYRNGKLVNIDDEVKKDFEGKLGDMQKQNGIQNIPMSLQAKIKEAKNRISKKLANASFSGTFGNKPELEDGVVLDTPVSATSVSMPESVPATLENSAI